MLPRPPLTFINILASIIVSVIFIVVMSRPSEIVRRRVSALLIAGAGAVYFGGGFGWWRSRIVPSLPGLPTAVWTITAI